MPGSFSLNTTDLPTLSQVLIALDDSTLFDYLRQQSGAAVVVTDPRSQATLRKVKVGSFYVLTEGGAPPTVNYDGGLATVSFADNIDGGAATDTFGTSADGGVG